MTNYAEMNRELEALIGGVPYKIANLANAAALLWQHMDGLNWAGFYLLEGEKLVLGPFQGKPACIEIPIGKGVCGTAVARNETMVIPNVHDFPGHIACDCASNAEIVIPLRKNGEIIGVLDIDSPLFDRFGEQDRVGLEEFSGILEKNL